MNKQQIEQMAEEFLASKGMKNAGLLIHHGTEYGGIKGLAKLLTDFYQDAGKESEGEAADIYDSLYMEVVRIVEKDSSEGLVEYKDTAKRLQRMFTITRKK